MAHEYAAFDYIPPPGLTGQEPRHPVAIIGAGPVGLALAIDLAQRGIGSVVLDDNNVVSTGSRAICWAKRTLEIFDRLGVGARMLDKGVTWQVGRQFHGDQPIYAFDLLPEPGHRYPAFVNLQQYYVEHYLVERARDFPDLIDLRFLNKVTDHLQQEDHVTLSIDTPDGDYELEADWLIACDGARSPTRTRMGLPFEGETFDEHFLIVDVEMTESPFGKEDTPERWFWFDPPFHQGQSALLHKQPDNIYRIDLQLGPESDPEKEAREENVIPRIKAIVGDAPFRLDWMSVYRFRCARLARFVHDRVIFAGDSAHVVSPFGARGGNGGIQDIDNLGWKLAAVITGEAPRKLIGSYDDERGFGADENILHSARATNFMTPKTAVEALFRNAVLRLARDHTFARKLINSGRLSRPCVLDRSPLQTQAQAPHPVGAALTDAPLLGPDGKTWLLGELPLGFSLLHVSNYPIGDSGGLPCIGVGHRAEYPCFEDSEGLMSKRYGSGMTYLVRPDGHVAAAFEDATDKEIARALARAKGENP